MEEPILVPERDSTTLAPSDPRWLAIADSDILERLQRRKILSVSIDRGKIRIGASMYVGQAVAAGVVIRITSKVQGAFEALLAYATGKSFRVERVASPASELDALVRLLVHQFLDAVELYLSRGRAVAYTQRAYTGALAGGKLDVIRTILLRASGRGHLIAFARNELTYDQPVNRVVRAALAEVESLAELVSVSASDVARTRGLLLLFEQSSDPAVLYRSRRSWATDAERLLSKAEDVEVRDLLSLAAILLSHASFGVQLLSAAAVAPRSWFVNLEKLFEQAVRRVIADLLGGAASVTRGEETRPNIFDLSYNYKANPDVVIALGDRAVVGDAKYKKPPKTKLGRRVRNADVYQLLVHAKAFEAPQAFLIYAGTHYKEAFLGKAVTGTDVWMFTIDVCSMRPHTEKLLTTMGMIDAGVRIG